MKVLLINGSPNIDGCTARALKEVEVTLNKEGIETERWIRQIDLVPTVAFMAGVRVPDQCEGAPIYQIMEQY